MTAAGLRGGARSNRAIARAHSIDESAVRQIRKNAKVDIIVAFENSQVRSSDDIIDTAITSFVAAFASVSIEETLDYAC